VEHAFGRGRTFALGMEEELLLVDAETHRLAPVSSDLLGRVREGEGSVLQDVYEALVEITSPICAHAIEGGAALMERRTALAVAGATLMGCGIHPDGVFGDAPHVPAERYKAIAGQMRGLLRRTPTCALHVHVGMPDPETAIQACNRMRAHLPVLQGLAAHSPYWHGADSGFATARAQLFRGYPRADIPRAFDGWEDYAETMSAFVKAADVPDYTFLWWDIRPHPRLGPSKCARWMRRRARTR
jgi:carboxylate-amine ligase